MLNWFSPPSRRFRAAIDLLAAVLFVSLPLCAATWKVQLYYDKDNSSLQIHDLKCPSAKTCYAAGTIVETAGSKDKVKGTLLLTSDGGAHWTYEELSEPPQSIFFLNETTGWMVTPKGVWQTNESGHNWKRLKAMKDLSEVWFLDESHGFAAGAPKAIYETHDGGKEWT